MGHEVAHTKGEEQTNMQNHSHLKGKKVRHSTKANISHSLSLKQDNELEQDKDKVIKYQGIRNVWITSPSSWFQLHVLSESERPHIQ